MEVEQLIRRVAVKGEEAGQGGQFGWWGIFEGVGWAWPIGWGQA